MAKLKNAGLILPDGISNFGTNTLSTQLVKLGLKGFALNKMQTGFDKSKLRTEGLSLYDNFSHLSEMLKEQKIETLFVISAPISEDQSAKWAEDLKSIKNKNNLQMILIWCERNPNISTKKLQYLIPEGVFDKVMCFYNKDDKMHKKMQEFFAPKNILSADFDIWTFAKNYRDNILPFSERENVVLYAGRYTNSKGTNLLIKAFTDGKIGERYRYSLEGGGYAISKKSGKITGALGVIQLLVKNKDIKAKELLDEVNLNTSYDNFWDTLSQDKLNTYPPYSTKDRDADRRKMSFFITPILSGEDDRAWFLWQMAPEYVFYESINQGLPIVCSKQFAETMHVNGKPIIDHDGHGFVIFDGYEELEAKLDEYCENYDENLSNMLDYWESSMDLTKKVLKKRMVKFIESKGKKNPYPTV